MAISQNAVTLTQPLALGSNGEEVRALQSLLNALQLGPMVTVDGRFGKMTHGALQKFQRQKGLKPDGVIGPSTAKALGWNYRSDHAKPYTVRYDAPPLPAMTPPLAVVAEVIRTGMATFKELLADRIRGAYARTNFGVPTPEETYKGQFRQVKLRLDDLDNAYDKLMVSLKKMVDVSGSEGVAATSSVRDAFLRFVTDMRSAFRAMEYYSAGTRAAHQALDRLPYQQIVANVERLLKGELTAIAAVGQIQIALDNANRIFQMSSPG